MHNTHTVWASLFKSGRAHYVRPNLQRLRSAPPPTSELTDEEIFRLLRIVKKRSEEDWLVFRLLIEHDFKVGECVGNSSPTANLPGIQMDVLSMGMSHDFEVAGYG